MNPRTSWSLVLCVLCSAGCASEGGGASTGEGVSIRRPTHTYSIVARDLETGDLGVAVESHWFNVGSIVPWAEAGVGAVATQSFADPSYGPRCLDLLRKGVPTAQALKEVLESDPGQGLRQVAVVDALGNAAAHTGARCIEAAGHHLGNGYSVQANMMLTREVVPAMVKAYENARGELAEKLLKALEAAQAAGGDIRGQQSAALLVVKGKSSGRPWKDLVVHLRVEDHPEAVWELRRLYQVHQAYLRMNAGDAALERRESQRALEEYQAAFQLASGNMEVVFWAAVGLAQNGRLEEARPMFEGVFKKNANWKELLRRLPKAGIIPDDPAGRKLIEEILKIGP